MLDDRCRTVRRTTTSWSTRGRIYGHCGSQRSLVTLAEAAELGRVIAVLGSTRAQVWTSADPGEGWTGRGSRPPPQRGGLQRGLGGGLFSGHLTCSKCGVLLPVNFITSMALSYGAPLSSRQMVPLAPGTCRRGQIDRTWRRAGIRPAGMLYSLATWIPVAAVRPAS